jgi:arabinogalactan oligomer/maltooligosaccharide transport system substrate-binding protein
MMKKSITIIAISSVMVGLVGCGSGSGNGDSAQSTPSVQASPTSIAELKPEIGASITVWDSYEEKAFIEETAAKFATLYDVKINFGEMNPEDAMEQLNNDGPVGMAADVIASDGENIDSAIANGLVMKNTLYRSQIAKTATAASVSGASYDGTLYGFPASQNTTVLYVNKDLFDSVPTTWSEISEFAQGFNKPADNRYAIMWVPNSPYMTYGFFGNAGLNLFGKSGTSTSKSNYDLTDSKVVEAGNRYRALRDSILPLTTSELTKPNVSTAFTNGQTAMVFGDSRDLELYKAKVPQLAVTPLPPLADGSKLKPISMTKSYYINNHSPYPNASRLFAAYLTAAEQQATNFTMTGAIPTAKAVLASKAVKANPVAAAFISQLKSSKPIPVIRGMDAYNAAMKTALTTMWDDQTDAADALKVAVETMKARLAE